MKIYSSHQEKRIIERLVSHTCDFCKKEIKDKSYQTSEVDVRYKEGESYPESGYGEHWELDICGDCFKDKLIPWAKSLGAPMDKKEWDY